MSNKMPTVLDKSRGSKMDFNTTIKKNDEKEYHIYCYIAVCFRTDRPEQTV